MPRKVATRTTRRGSLDPVFCPRSIAVIGASRRPQSMGYEVLHNLLEFGFEGPVYPINPSAEHVHSLAAYRSLSQVPGPVDMAIVIVPKSKVLRVLDDCGRKGVRGVIMITAGFKEVGTEGARLELAVAKKLRRYGMRMVGPNCMGVINTEPSIRMNATFASSFPSRGNVGFISQSGALGEAILAQAVERGIGVAMFVSMGNKADVSGNDLLEYWENDDDVEAILMYLESFGNPRRFKEIARRVTRKKPVITVKAGRTAAGAKAASSHTGSIVGLDIATDSLLQQCGVLRVSTMEEMFVQATALAQQPVPAGDRVAIVTNAGGPGILCTDSCVGRGLPLAELSAATRRAMSKVLPSDASTVNPVDMIASADADAYRRVLKLVRRDPGVDAIIAIFVSPIMTNADDVAEAIAESTEGSKPVLSVFMGKHGSAGGIAKLRQHRVPVYSFPEDAASAMSALVRYGQMRNAPVGRSRTYRVSKAKVRTAIASARRAGRTALVPSEVERVLGAYGFPLAPSRIVDSAAEAIAAAQELGYPVVLKVASSKILHKTDVGGVKVDLRNADEVGRAYADLRKRLGRHDRDMRVSVQRLIAGGREVILGMAHDGQFGPVLMFGLGGVFVEVLRDVSVRIPPLTDVGARTMIERLRAYPLLAGVRGEKPADIELLIESLLRLSQLVTDFGDELEELDINPFIVTDRRDTSFVVDARIVLRPRSVGGSRGKAID